MRTLFVGNLPFSSTQSDISDLFSQFGNVSSVTMIVHKESGRPRGFCFVELEDDDAAANAVSALNDTDFGGRRLKVEFRHRDAEAGRAQPRTNSQA